LLHLLDRCAAFAPIAVRECCESCAASCAVELHWARDALLQIANVARLDESERAFQDLMTANKMHRKPNKAKHRSSKKAQRNAVAKKCGCATVTIDPATVDAKPAKKETAEELPTCDHSQPDTSNHDKQATNDNGEPDTAISSDTNEATNDNGEPDTAISSDANEATNDNGEPDAAISSDANEATNDNTDDVAPTATSQSALPSATHRQHHQPTMASEQEQVLVAFSMRSTSLYKFAQCISAPEYYPTAFTRSKPPQPQLHPSTHSEACEQLAWSNAKSRRRERREKARQAAEFLASMPLPDCNGNMPSSSESLLPPAPLNEWHDDGQPLPPSKPLLERLLPGADTQRLIGLVNSTLSCAIDDSNVSVRPMDARYRATAFRSIKLVKSMAHTIKERCLQQATPQLILQVSATPTDAPAHCGQACNVASCHERCAIPSDIPHQSHACQIVEQCAQPCATSTCQQVCTTLSFWHATIRSIV
jgi:hypothetical protein